MGGFPTGTVTFLFTDLEGSTQLWEEHPEAMKEAVAVHDRILGDAIEAHGGSVVKHTGDGVMAVFPSPAETVEAAVAAQRGLGAQAWEGPVLRARMGIHIGTAHERHGDYFGPTVNRTARLMDAGHGGQVLVSLAAGELARDHLPEDVGLIELGEHRLRDLSRPERVFQLEARGLERDFPALRTLDAVPNNLPVALSSFVGREQELARVGALLETHRLVTLTGVGGTGKTRLALHYAASALERFPDGIHLVELAPMKDPALVPEAVATAVSVQQNVASNRSPIEHLAACLRDQRMLVVLDNCEHVIDATARLAEGLLQGCAELSVLATSREALGVEGEQAFKVPSLGLPDDGGLDCESARLFLERARSADPDFEVGDPEALGEICRRLDGIPLAIELAAARAGSLSLAELARHLDHQFRLLTGGRRTAVERHRTLRAAIDWSHELLSEDARTLLPRLGVFASSWSLEGAEAVCADDALGVPGVLDALGELVDKSMVSHDRSTDRYRMVEPLRQYALERLGAAGETEALRDRHAAWIEDRLALSSFEDWANRVNDLETTLVSVVEYPNVVAAARWLLERGDADTAARIRAGTLLATFATGRHGEALKLADAVLAGDDLAGWARHLIQIASVYHAVYVGDLTGARARAEEAISLGEAHPEATSPHWLTGARAEVALAAGGLGELTDELEMARSEFASAGDRYMAQAAAVWLGAAAKQDGDYERAVRLLQEAYEAAEDFAFGWVPYAPVYLALSKVLAGHDDVETALEEAEAIARSSGDPLAIAFALDARAAAGPAGPTRAALEESFRIVRRHGLSPWPCLEAAAWYGIPRARPEEVTRALGALSRYVELTGDARWRGWTDWARARLGDGSFAEHFRAGARAGAEAVIEAMLADEPEA